jgi:hypothetical protein
MILLEIQQYPVLKIPKMDIHPNAVQKFKSGQFIPDNSLQNTDLKALKN